MNINDNKLNELMKKTQNTIQRKVRRRRYILSSSLAAAAVVAVIGILSLGVGNSPDMVIDNSFDYVLFSKNNNTIIQDVDEWSETRSINKIDFTASIKPHSILLPENLNLSDAKLYQVSGYEFSEEDAFGLAKYFLNEPFFPVAFTADDYPNVLKLFENMDTSNYSDTELIEYKNQMEIYKSIVEKENLPSMFGHVGSPRYDVEAYYYAFRSKSNESMSSFLTIYNKYNNFVYPWVSYVRAENWYEFKEINDINDIALSDRQQVFYKKAYDAAASAVETFSDNMVLTNALLAERTNLYSSPEYSENKGVKDSSSIDNMAIVFYFAKQYPLAGIDGINAFTITKYNPADESIKITVDKDGIALFSWVGKSDIMDEVEIVKPSISLNDAILVYKDNVFNINMRDTDISKIEIEIDKIVFTFKNIKTSEGNQIVPTYSFFGTQTATIDKNDKSNSVYKDFVLIVNAIDGSIIQ